MSFQLLAGGTCSVTGGSARTYAQDGNKVTTGKSYSDLNTADARIQPRIALKNRQPSYTSSTGKWRKARREAVVSFPALLASGELVYNTYRIIAEVHPEIAQATELAQRQEAVQASFDAELATFWTAGRTEF